MISVLEVFTNAGGLIRTIGPWLKQIRRSNGSLVKHAAYLLEAMMLRRQTKRDGIRHVHAHFSTNSTAVAMLAKLLGGPSIASRRMDRMNSPTRPAAALR